MKEKEFLQKYTKGYNSQQIEAIRTIEGPVLLLAVPGSGKTTVLITRLGYMVLVLGIAPESILVMTYTVAAAKEMKDRFAKLFGAQYAERIDFRTINSFSNGVIQYYTSHFSNKVPFVLKTESELNHLLANIYHSLSNEYASEAVLKEIRTGITLVKNSMMSTAEIHEQKWNDENFEEVYKIYCREMMKKGWMDFDDQMRYALLFLTKVPALKDYYQSRYQYICVDEAQDTSQVQYEIIRLICQKTNNLFMVGDEDQSIYGFRAAEPEILMHFQEISKDAKVLLMETNFRSTANITTAADSFVQHDQMRHPKSMRAVRDAGNQVHIIETATRKDQYVYLAAAAKTEREMTILYRNNDSAIPLIDLLTRESISFSVRQMDTLFFTNRIVSDILDCIHFALDPKDNECFMRIYYKFSVSITKSEAAEAVKKSQKTNHSILMELIGIEKNWQKSALIDLEACFDELRKAKGSQLIDIIYNQMNYRKYVEDRNMDRNKIDILKMIAEKTKDAKDFLARMDQLQNIMQGKTTDEHAKVLLSTIHSAKGREFDRVYLLDTMDSILPSVKKDKDPGLYEEERRIFYVGITRAKDDLYLFHIPSESQSFVKEVIRDLPAEYINPNDIFAFLKQNLLGKTYTSKNKQTGKIIGRCEDEVCLEYPKHEYKIETISEMLKNRSHVYAKEKGKQDKQKKQKLTAGMTVSHSSFGIGKITQVMKKSVIIDFESVGKKRIDRQKASQNHLIQIMER